MPTRAPSSSWSTAPLAPPGCTAACSSTRAPSHNQDGFLAGTLEEWEAYLTQLIDGPALRHRLASAAQQKLRERWLLSDGAARWGEVYRPMCAEPAPGAAPQLLAILQLAQRWIDELGAELPIGAGWGGPTHRRAGLEGGSLAAVGSVGTRAQAPGASLVFLARHAGG
jgi:hypothetical protein